MAKEYDPKAIEQKWQDEWERSGIYHAVDDSDKKKYYALIEFPYPSGTGLHIGHPRPYTCMDVVARKRRMEGHNVLFPMGWDAFGLPTENYAIKTGKDPRVVTKENTDYFRKQAQAFGFSFDWSREVNTTDPLYYKWTQWIFIQMFKKGLAYKGTATINWCPKDKIGLANEEVVNGTCERCGTEVEKREKEQWMLGITKYADRLYTDLDTVDYPERVVAGQRNWIGKSEGAEISFELVFADAKLNQNRGPTGEKAAIPVFTTRPDTLFGATYIVLAPEHQWVTLALDTDHVGVIQNADEVRTYVDAAKKKPEIERTAEGKDKTGVQVTGVVAINPATKEEIPLFVADYVLAHYGTGAVMGVPAHDERDNQFAKKYSLPSVQVVAPYTLFATGTEAVQSDENIFKFTAGTAIIKHWEKELYYVVAFVNNVFGFVGGHREDGEAAVDTARREATEESGYTDIKSIRPIIEHSYSRGYKSRKSREEECHDAAYVVELGSDARVDIVDTETKKGLWMTAEEVLNCKTFLDHHKLYFELYLSGKAFAGDGILVNSGEYDGRTSEDAKKKITEAVGGKMVTTFKLRDWVFSRQRYWGEPIPMVYCTDCRWQSVPEDQLPVVLPQVDKYEPTDNGESPLSKQTDWIRTTCPNCGKSARRETDVMPNWAGSSWYYLRYTDPHNDVEFASKKNIDYWTPVDWYNGGMEHTVLHLLYSRFWHKFLYDQGLVPTIEPYAKRTSHGLFLAADGTKISKSKGNGIDPMEIIGTYGADATRLYIAFIGPFEAAVPWQSDGLVGTHRFIERVVSLSNKLGTGSPGIEVHQAVKKVGDDIEATKFNTAVSTLMILTNKLHEQGTIPTASYEVLLKLLAPFAPHVTEELWQSLGHTTSIHLEPWPTYDTTKLVSDTVTVAFQLGGKTRGAVTVARGAGEAEVLAAVAKDEKLAQYMPETPKRIVFVQDKVLNVIP